MAATHPADLAMMLLAGVCNAVAFAALTKSLHLTSIVYVNILNATQATLAAVAGVVFFHEAASWPLFVGGFLTIVGLVCMRQWRKRPKPVPALEPEALPLSDAGKASATQS
jgi:drug/metabolite transporter (DMT)-like permease